MRFFLSSLPFFFLACAAAQDPSEALPQQSSTSERFQYYLQRTYSWQRMSWLAADTGLDHLLHESEWGRGMGGYGRQATLALLIPLGLVNCGPRCCARSYAG